MTIFWFGGEPTLKRDDILNFMGKAEEICLQKKIVLTSSITTNGYLLTKQMLEKFLEVGIRYYQLTLDGVKDEHDKKRPLLSGVGSFDTVIKNLKDIKNSELDFSLNLRYNYDENSTIKDFIDYISPIIKNDRRILLDFQAVGKWNSDDTVSKQRINYIDIYQLLRYAREQGINVYKFSHLGVFDRGCQASESNSILVRHNGDILRCTVKLDSAKNIVGKISANGEIIFNKNLDLWTDITPKKECLACEVRPLCLNRYCPHRTDADCKESFINEIQGVLLAKYD